jgi:hypothetical protein
VRLFGCVFTLGLFESLLEIDKTLFEVFFAHFLRLHLASPPAYSLTFSPSQLLVEAILSRERALLREPAGPPLVARCFLLDVEYSYRDSDGIS